MAKRKRPKKAVYKPRRIPRGLPGAGQFATRELVEQLKLEKYYQTRPFVPKYEPKPTAKPVRGRKRPPRKVPREREERRRRIAAPKTDKERMRRIISEMRRGGYLLASADLETIAGSYDRLWRNFRLTFAARYKQDDVFEWLEIFQRVMGRTYSNHKAMFKLFIEFEHADGERGAGWRSFYSVTGVGAAIDQVRDQLEPGPRGAQWAKYKYTVSGITLNTLIAE